MAAYTLKIALAGAKPPIWRRVVVPGALSLGQLHDIIQIAMGWFDSHLHQFEHDGTIYGPPDRNIEYPRTNEKRTRLDEVLRQPGDRMHYEYDFGDSWTHHIVVEAIDDGAAATTTTLLKARGACPPEDVGGLGGFERFVEAMRDPEDPEHAAMLEWHGSIFDPAAVDIAAINRRLQKLRLRELQAREPRRKARGVLVWTEPDPSPAFREKLKAKMDDPAAILNDREVKYLAAHVGAAIEGVPAETLADLPSAEDMVRWSSVVARCRQAREGRNWTIDDAARELKVAQSSIAAVEKGPVSEYRLEVAVRYFRLLGLESWIAKWARSNPALARRQGLA